MALVSHRPEWQEISDIIFVILVFGLTMLVNLDEINMCLREHLLYTYNMVCVVKIIQFFYAPPLSIIYIEGETN